VDDEVRRELVRVTNPYRIDNQVEMLSVRSQSEE